MKKGAERKQAKNGKTSFIIMIGDEGGILLQLQGKNVIKRLFAQSPSKEHTRALNDALNSMQNAPVTILVDMMDQSYVKQTLPPVSSFNVGKIVRRRLNKDFATDDVKGYLIFGRDKKGRKDWNYLMVSLANSQPLQQWVDFAVERPNPFKGIALVPLEAQPMVATIEKAQMSGNAPEAKPTEWHMLISHHKVGGFRQIVFRNGQLVFTRLAQMVGEPTPEVIAGNIEQEMLNTLEYLKRLGLQDIGALTATIIASGEIKQVFDSKTIRKGQCFFYTPHEAAAILQLDDVGKPEDHFGDIVLAGYIGRKRKLLLPLFTSYTARINKLVKYSMITKMVTTVIALAILGWGGMLGMDWYNASSTIEDLENNQRSVSAQLSELTQKKNALPAQINRYYDVANIFKSFYRPSYDVLHFTQRLYVGIRGNTTINSLKWSLSNTVVAAKDEDKRSVTVEFESNLVPNENREKFVSDAQKLVESVKATFPDYEVTTSDLPGMLSDKEELKTVINESGNITSSESKAQNTTVKFTLKGPITKPMSGAAPGMPPGMSPQNQMGGR